MRIHIDTMQCEGHGQCAATSPELYDLDDDGFATPADFDVPQGSEGQAEAGATSCPMGAIKVVS